MREDQTTADEAYEHSRDGNKTAQRFPSKREEGDNDRASERCEKDKPRKNHFFGPLNTRKDTKLFTGGDRRVHGFGAGGGRIPVLVMTKVEKQTQFAAGREPACDCDTANFPVV